MKKLLIPVMLTFGMVLTPHVSAAHHGNAAYATATPVTVKGVVTEWFWANPHCLLKFDAKDDSGNVVNWVAEVSNPPDMLRQGWSKSSFKMGDEVTVILIVAKNNLPVGRIRQVTTADGQVYKTTGGGGGAAPPAPAGSAQR